MVTPAISTISSRSVMARHLRRRAVASDVAYFFDDRVDVVLRIDHHAGVDAVDRLAVQELHEKIDGLIALSLRRLVDRRLDVAVLDELHRLIEKIEPDDLDLVRSPCCARPRFPRPASSSIRAKACRSCSGRRAWRSRSRHRSSADRVPVLSVLTTSMPGNVFRASRAPFSRSSDHWAAASMVVIRTLPLPSSILPISLPASRPDWTRSCPAKASRLAVRIVGVEGHDRNARLENAVDHRPERVARDRRDRQAVHLAHQRLDLADLRCRRWRRRDR